MLIEKCDLCHKEILKGNNKIIVGQDWLRGNTFCAICAKPIMVFLKKHKLIKPAIKSE